jgi:unsaturated rhamnogalacturonyl hydrolase
MSVSSPRLMLAITCAASLIAEPPAGPVVAVDGYHNHEAEPHYRWEGTYPGGFSKAAALLRSMGAELRTLQTEFSADSLRGIDCLIVVDPDTPAETPHPKYISDREARAAAQWVKHGGVLVLLGNNVGNAEFEHLNGLARRFGITFIETTHRNAASSGKLRIRVPNGNPVFPASLEFYAVDVAPLQVQGPARILLQDGGAAIMALTRHGRGFVFALGDPWFYNEYINMADNWRLTEALFRHVLFAKN